MHGIKTWLLVCVCCLYFVFCWFVYTCAVDPLYGATNPPRVAADSGAYFAIAGLDEGSSNVDASGLVGYGGSPLGPVVIALMGRTTLGVAWINCLLFLAMLFWVAKIPGVRPEWFFLLMALDAQMLPTLMTLNKEILAGGGMAAFAAYLYRRREPGGKWGGRLLLAAGIVLSILARWEQVVVLFWYMGVEWKRSPLRGKPRRGLIALLLLLSAGYGALIHVLHINLSGFLAQIEGGGTIVRLYNIQQSGGYFLVAFPKILMNLGGLLITPGYFLGTYWTDSFGSSDWQNAYVGILSNLAMLGLPLVMLSKGRFRLSRPLVQLAMIYFIFTALNPFIQPRYMFPGYVVLAIEMSRHQSRIEPVVALPKMPPLPAAYLGVERAMAAAEPSRKQLS